MSTETNVDIAEIKFSNGKTNGHDFKLISMWVTFIRNPKMHDHAEREESERPFNAIGAEKTYRFESQFIGQRSDGSSQKKVFPKTQFLEEAILQQVDLSPDDRCWDLPVFANEGPNIYSAYQFDKTRHKKESGLLFAELTQKVRDRLIKLEAEVAELVKFFKEWVAPYKTERMLAIVDYQNIERTLRSILREGKREAIPITLFSIVEKARLWNVCAPRRLSKAFVFDFESPFNIDFRNMVNAKDGYQYVSVDPKTGENPTDQAIIDHTFKHLEEHPDAYDTICLFSGDGDFIDLVRELKNRGYKVMVASFLRSTALSMIIESGAILNLEEFMAD